MKKNISLFLSLLFFLSINLVSCSSDEDDLSVDEKISIHLNKEFIIANGEDAIIFTVKDNDSNDVTTASEIYIDGVKLESNKFTSTSEGEYTAKAVYKDLEATTSIKVRPFEVRLYLSTDKTFILADGKEAFTITVKDQNQKDITSVAKIYVDDVKLENNSYSSTTAGTHTLKAVYEKLEATLDLDVRPYKTRLYISSNQTSTFSSAPQEFVFKVLDSKMTNISSQVKFYVDDNLIDGNTFNSSTPGRHKVRAEFLGNTSADLSIGVDMSPRNVLVEDYTATWCGYCPESMYHLEEMKSKTSANLVISAIHGSDEFQYAKIESLFSTYNISGYPTKIANRKVSQEIYESNLTSLVNESCDLGIKPNLTLNGNEAQVDVFVESYKDVENIKIVVAICDNNQLADQANYYNSNATSNFYQAGDPMKNFQHNYILRKTLTDLYGDAIPNEKLTQGSSYKLSFTTDVSKYNKAHLSVIAFLVKDAEVINAISVDNL